MGFSDPQHSNTPGGFSPSLQSGILHENRRREFLLGLRMTDGSFQDEIEQQRVVVVDFIERSSFFAGDEAVYPYDGILLEYANLVDIGHTLPTCSCSIQLLRPKEKTKSHRHTSTTVYYSFRGRGMTKVSANEMNWDKGDIFVVPPWQWHAHENTTSEDAILFSISDRPATEALGRYRKEAE